MDRRTFVAAIAGAVVPVVSPQLQAPAAETSGGKRTMYGLIGKITATPGQRDALVSYLLEGTGGMPGCLSYVVAQDPANADAIWVTEVWQDEASHKASLALPAVQSIIAKAKPIIAGFSDRVVTTPVGGVGLPAAATPP